MRCIKRLVSTGLLVFMVTMSLITITRAGNYIVYNQTIQWDEFVSGYKTTSWANKDTDSSIHLFYNWGETSNSTYIPISFEAMGAHDFWGNGETCLSGAYYFYPGDSTMDMCNYVNEGGYDYAAIRATYFGDSMATINITWQLDN